MPTKSHYENLHLFELIGLSSEVYQQKLLAYYEEKKVLFKISMVLDIPIVLVLTIFSTIHFNYPWWAFFIYFTVIALISFFIICLPVYHSSIKPIKKKEAQLFLEIDKELSKLATNHYFSDEAKAKRLLNQEFELIKLQPLSSKKINLILENQSLATQTIDFYDKFSLEVQHSTTIFYEELPLKPIALATINFVGADKTFSIQTQIPIEYEIVNGLVSEQVIYFDKKDYVVNPTVYIDRAHFYELYESN